METIRNYLEAMFSTLPNYTKNITAKYDLLKIMENKYNELIAEGRNENEAIGLVISEYGNLDDLPEGIVIETDNVTAAAPTAEVTKRNLYIEEVKEYINAKKKHSLLIGFGVFLCINSVIGPIVSEFFRLPDMVGTGPMFIMISVAVLIFITSGTMFSKWKYITGTPCQIDSQTAGYIQNECENYRVTHAIRLSVGIIICIVCWMPTAILEEIHILGDLSSIFLFILVGLGVMLIIYTSSINSSLNYLASINDQTIITDHYNGSSEPEYINEGISVIMKLYWPTIFCIYISWSFLTFSWWKTWIVWPVAAIIFTVLKSNLRKN